jgi:hypothetical protein
MNTTLVHIVKQIIAANGETILEDPARLKAFFSDLAKDEPKPLRLAFGRSLEAGAYIALKTAPDAAERAVRKAAIAQRLRDEHGLDIALCGEALDILEAVLCGEAAPRNLCKNCGNTIQEGWKMCPYCGTACGAAEQSAPPAPLPKPPVQLPPAAVSVVPPTPSKSVKQGDDTLNKWLFRIWVAMIMIVIVIVVIFAIIDPI